MKKARRGQENGYASRVGLKSLIQQHGPFFDKLAELIPANFSSATDSAHKSKSAHDNQRNPENASESVPEAPMSSHPEHGTNDVTYEGLQRRLRSKIGETAGGTDETIPRRKRGREPGLVEVEPSESPSVEKEGDDVERAARELEFSRVKLGGKSETGKRHKRRREVTMKELERARKLEAAKNDPEKGDAAVKKHSWEAAASRAAGARVYDRPSVLEKKLKMEKKLCQKKAERWKARIEAQQKMKEEKQKMRSQNIADRITQKKMRRIARREKKLLRPGFEGRKEGYINDQ